MAQNQEHHTEDSRESKVNDPNSRGLKEKTISQEFFTSSFLLQCRDLKFKLSLFVGICFCMENGALCKRLIISSLAGFSGN